MRGPWFNPHCCPNWGWLHIFWQQVGLQIVSMMLEGRTVSIFWLMSLQSHCRLMVKACSFYSAHWIAKVTCLLICSGKPLLIKENNQKGYSYIELRSRKPAQRTGESEGTDFSTMFSFASLAWEWRVVVRFRTVEGSFRICFRVLHPNSPKQTGTCVACWASACTA